MIGPHDLLWIADAAALSANHALPEWVSQRWQPSLPLVVRRDRQDAERIPVGIRGMKRSERAAAWVNRAAIVRVVTPESLVADPLALLHSPFACQPVLQALIALAQHPWPWAWGVTGSCGYALATGVAVLHADSDLDLLVRCPRPVAERALVELAQRLRDLPCRADAQIETPFGGFALSEWLRDRRVMLKTATGPLLTKDPWQPPQEQ